MALPEKAQSDLTSPAPLPGTNHALRLMREGTNSPTNGGGHLIVKQEWDAAEAWMSAIERENPMN